jgi:hypothetical protein
MSAGAWLREFGVVESSPSPPEQFFHMFMVIGGPAAIEPGSIVRGMRWDTDGLPRYRVVYGWGMADAYLPSSDLSYLGQNFDLAWISLGAAVRAKYGGVSNGPLIDTRTVLASTQ